MLAPPFSLLHYVGIIGVLVLGHLPTALSQQDDATENRVAYATPGIPHPGADQIWWVPTFAQAKVAARESGRLILVMGSVSDWRDGY